MRHGFAYAEVQAMTQPEMLHFIELLGGRKTGEPAGTRRVVNRRLVPKNKHISK
ncbi:hypothetical protein [Oleidesulfovibrio alaskensis]|uniref:hypothetical protein n=1 Tax=Oleidesulfovibrio alaskensis TaxID=58180 RepID=UPI00040B8E67|nr:hypothetical protein [Oleidesulfovibrio alaskensis]